MTKRSNPPDSAQSPPREAEARRGRHAARPQDLPRAGWRDVTLRVRGEIDRDNLGIVAAGVAFYAFLAIFPALAAAVSIYGLVADPAEVEAHFREISSFMPEQARTLLEAQLGRIAGQAGGALTVGLVVGLAVTLWSANKGMKGLMRALSIVHDESEERGFFKLNLLGLALTLGGILVMLLALALVVAIPAILGSLGLGSSARTLLNVLRWPVVAIVILGALAVLYRLGPDREAPRWRWVTPGAAIATALWLLGSAAFSIYVSRFGSYNQTYGSAATFVVLLLWLFLTAYVILLGAEINAELEHQTRRDTTTGHPKPMGDRAAYVADHVGRTPR